MSLRRIRPAEGADHPAFVRLFPGLGIDAEPGGADHGSLTSATAVPDAETR